jgi:hypothetical protein
MNKPTYEELLSQRDHFKNGMAELQDIIDKMQPERDAFAIRLEDSESQYSELHDRNSALAAQVELMRSALELAFISVKTCYKQDLAPFSDVVTVEKAIKLKPAACLAQVKVDVVHDFVNYVVDNDLSNTLEAAAFQFGLINKGDKP